MTFGLIFVLALVFASAVEESCSVPGGKSLINGELNRGLNFAASERETYGLQGFLPAGQRTLEVQMEQVMWNVRRKTDRLDKYQYFMTIYHTNQKLFYYTLVENVFELMPIVYTPTVGAACKDYGAVTTFYEGLFININHLGRVKEVLQTWPHPEVDGIVVTDGERILGLGDLGAQGMGIPVGKLALYSACGGLDPKKLLPITLDVGTNTESLLENPFYPGLRQKRTEGDDYDALIEELMQAATELYGPQTLIQFEDFANKNAFRMLDRYRENYNMFNDDIQGTASVVVAGLISAMRIKQEKLKDQVIVFLGAGSAGIGIAELIAMYISLEENISMVEARRNIWLIDSRGLIFKDRIRLNELKSRYAHTHPLATGTPEDLVKDLTDIVKVTQATALIGVSGMPDTFTERVVKQMAVNDARPIIFPLSNPNSMSEVDAANSFAWTNDQCIFASGSPWPKQNITYGGETYEIVPSQGNNAYIFPGVALGAIAIKSRSIPEEYFLSAAEACSSLISDEFLKMGLVYPPIEQIREVSLDIAVGVAEKAYEMGLATVPRPDDLRAYIQSIQFDHTAY